MMTTNNALLDLLCQNYCYLKIIGLQCPIGRRDSHGLKSRERVERVWIVILILREAWTMGTIQSVEIVAATGPCF